MQVQNAQTIEVVVKGLWLTLPRVSLNHVRTWSGHNYPYRRRGARAVSETIFLYTRVYVVHQYRPPGEVRQGWITHNHVVYQNNLRPYLVFLEGLYTRVYKPHQLAVWSQD